MELCEKIKLAEELSTILFDPKQRKRCIDMGPIKNDYWSHRFLYRDGLHKYTVVYDSLHDTVTDIRKIV